MRTEQSRQADPFRCYLGRRITLEQCAHVVECYEVHGSNLLFRLRQVGSRREIRLTVLELLDLFEKQKVGAQLGALDTSATST